MLKSNMKKKKKTTVTASGISNFGESKIYISKKI